jgi:hypothetical protein
MRKREKTPDGGRGKKMDEKGRNLFLLFQPTGKICVTPLRVQSGNNGEPKKRADLLGGWMGDHKKFTLNRPRESYLDRRSAQ